MREDELGGLLTDFAEALWREPHQATGTWEALAERWPEEASRLTGLAALVSWLDRFLVPVRPAPAFQDRLSRELVYGDGRRTAIGSGWRTVAVAGSVVSVLGLAVLWRRRRTAGAEASLEVARPIDVPMGAAN